ncbi:hypothetical protein V1478_009489 [Vespula squamosa]|uniref:Uncharacterized protein n=1 Tax=Vespula squamosa TaxID=30214 RepID=A0ABD2APS8_VESSQ
MPFLQAVTKSGSEYNIEIVHSRSSGARDDNKVGPSNDFVDFWHSYALTFDECTSQLSRDALKLCTRGLRVRETTTKSVLRTTLSTSGTIEIVHSRSSGARDDNKVGPSNDFVDFWHSYALTFDECTSQLSRDAFPGSHNEGEKQIEIVHPRSSDARDDTRIEPMIDFDLNFEEWIWSCALTVLRCTRRYHSRILKLCTRGLRVRETTTKSVLRTTLSTSGTIEIVHSRSSGARDDNKVGPSNDFVDFCHSYALTFDECTLQLPRDAFPGSHNEGEKQIEIVHPRSSDARDDTRIEPMIDFDLNFEEWT